MKCDEVRPLQGPYLDSELDSRTSLEIEQHLKACCECALLFEEEQKFEKWLNSGLIQGQRSDGFWEQTERALLGVVPTTTQHRRRRASGSPERDGWPALVQILRAWYQVACGAGPHRAWMAIAAVWVVILALNLQARETVGPALARHPIPSASEIRLAVLQKQLLLADPSVATETPAFPRAPAPGPRTQRGENTLKT